MKRIISILVLVAILMMSLTGCSSTTQNKGSVSAADDEKLINEIVDYFMPITKIPRQSHHEEQISEYLFSWAKERGFNPVKDKENNVIFDVPGTSGMENAPMTILQAHMDMVIAVADGKTFDPQKDGITVINDGKVLKADGTSLGADDAIGIAMIFHIIENNKEHGPLRIIFTTNEEDGMTGAFALTADSVKGAKNVINIDSENSTEVTNSAAAGVIASFSLEPEVTSPSKNKALTITISGLLSGHSGVDIDKGHLNGIKAIGELLKLLETKNVDYELVGIEGGSANNAIPAKAATQIVINSSDENTVKEIIDGYLNNLKDKYGEIEKDLDLKVEDGQMPQYVLTSDVKKDVVKFVSEIHDGINTMSTKVEGLVESSSNLGLISIKASKEEKSTASAYIRSSSDDKLLELAYGQWILAKECNIDMDAKITSDPWPVKLDNKLLDKVKAAYQKETGEEIKVVQLHAGLETGTFSVLDPELDIVSIGPDIKNPHTINETCDLTTLPKVYRVVETVLKEVGKEAK